MKIDFTSEKKVVRGVAVLKLFGRIDSFVFSVFRDQLLEAIEEGQHRLVLDLAQTENINTTCMGLIVSRLKQCRDQGGDIRLAGLTEYLKKIFSLIGVGKLFEIYDHPDQAVDSFFRVPK